ncbi:hypothetical protein LCGC14_2525710, partial [marine sediment metagenome]
LLRANQILALSGTTDIECPDCEGYRSTFSEFSSESCMDCTTCGNTGVIKHPWKVSVVLENGELPLISRKRAESAVGERDCGERIFEAEEKEDNIRWVLHGAEIQRDKDKYDSGYRQVVE